MNEKGRKPAETIRMEGKRGDYRRGKSTPVIVTYHTINLNLG
jgi:hypothetical protein